MLSTDFACRSRHQVARALAGDDYGLKSCATLGGVSNCGLAGRRIWRIATYC